MSKFRRMDSERREQRKKMSYTALYRKYRPARFSDVLGQEAIVRTLKNQIINGKVSHAYLFCGTRGTGKTSLAKIFAKAINCISPVQGEPCGVCGMCVEISGERSLNVIEIDAASNNGVDNIRDIREEARYTPTSGKFKVYIIDEVHMLSTGAYNALLKTLEEPPAHVIFVLATTDPQKIPATILSRCQRYDFKRITSELISDRLLECTQFEGVTAAQDALRYIARLSDGSMRDALSLLDRCVSFFEGEEITLSKVLEITGSIDSKSFFELTESLNAFNSAGALDIVARIVREGRDINRIITEALGHFRSLLIVKSAENPSRILDISEEASEELRKQSGGVDAVRLMSYINAFSALLANARYSPDARVLLEVELIKLCNPEIINGSYEELYGKVSELEKRLAGGIVYAPEQESAAKGRKNAAAVVSADEKKPEKKKLALPGDFSEFKERFNEIKSKLSAQRENHIFAAVIERADAGFLDDKDVYIIFEDETNEHILKNDPKKLELIKQAALDVTGKEYGIKTITRQRFENESKGIEFIKEKSAEGERLLESVKDAFGGFSEEI